MRIRSLLLVGAFVSIGGSGAVAVDQGKVIEQTAMDAHMPTSLAEQVRSADLIVRATITSAAVRGVPHVPGAQDREIHSPLLNVPDVFTYYALDVTETLKENSERSSPEQIAQKVGQMSWGDYLIKASSDHHPLLTGHSYLMFLRWSDALQVFTVTPSGAFEITQGRVVPMGSSPVAREYADRSAIEFARLIRMKAMERSR